MAVGNLVGECVSRGIVQASLFLSGNVLIWVRWL